MRSAETAEVARLLAVDPDVPGLRLLLDDDALGGWLVDRFGPAVVAAGVRRTYLRWKPGAGGVARVRVGGSGDGEGGTDLFLAVWHRDAAAKLDKTVLRGGRAVVAVDRGALAVLGRPAADRDLPGLGRVLASGPARGLRRLLPVDEPARRRLHRVADGSAGATTLAWKPQRRWVGLVGSDTRGRVVLRAYRPDDLPAVRERYRAVAAALAGTGQDGAGQAGAGEDGAGQAGACSDRTVPAVLGTHLRRGLLAVEHLAGRGLDHLDGVDAEAADRAAGTLLARLHGAPVRGDGPGPVTDGVGRLDLDAECDAVAAAARTVDLLVPDAAAGAVAADLVRALRALPGEPDALLHGDLSADQVVVDRAGGVGLIDLDEVAVGPASFDLAGITASWWLSDPASAGTRVRALLDGYGPGPTGPGPDALRVRTAAHLLRRAPEAFRTGRAGWPEQVARAVRTAALTLRGDGPPAAVPGSERSGVLR